MVSAPEHERFQLTRSERALLCAVSRVIPRTFGEVPKLVRPEAARTRCAPNLREFLSSRGAPTHDRSVKSPQAVAVAVGSRGRAEQRRCAPYPVRAHFQKHHIAHSTLRRDPTFTQPVSARTSHCPIESGWESSRSNCAKGALLGKTAPFDHLVVIDASVVGRPAIASHPRSPPAPRTFHARREPCVSTPDATRQTSATLIDARGKTIRSARTRIASLPQPFRLGDAAFTPKGQAGAASSPASRSGPTTRRATRPRLDCPGGNSRQNDESAARLLLHPLILPRWPPRAQPFCHGPIDICGRRVNVPGG